MPNPSVKGTCLRQAPYVERGAFSFVGPQTVVASKSFCALSASASRPVRQHAPSVRGHGLMREAQAGCPSVGGQRTGGLWPAVCSDGLGGSRVRDLVAVLRIIGPTRHSSGPPSAAAEFQR